MIMIMRFYLLTNFKLSPICKLKTFHEYKALISIKFANKGSIIRKTSWKFPMHYVKLCKYNIRFFGEFPFRKGKVEVLLIYCSFSFLFFSFCSFQVPLFPYCLKFKFCFLLILFACKDPSRLYKYSKRRNYSNLRI